MTVTVTYKGQWVAVCNIDDLIEGEASVFKAGGYEIYVVPIDGEIHVYYGRCPHAFGELAPSDFDGSKIVCNVHQWEFDPKTGASINPKGAKLFRLESEVRDGVLYVKVPQIPVVEFKEKYFKMYESL
ncbi:Rieske (2Fe-2S) protein [Pyrobaculum aerophilum]|uniref:Toluene monooxygenase n=1 Tax=Pyrobaculum aerophilum TaxID=13773 RepID=A0A371R5I8_9CREN|nr:Rieske 2Fe-2S domain-containing protein [Pyrobaculum aerophilum]RFA97591.1 toluene monooxygenase [Pyrobaculum aerophilum]RFA99346.1 toluene monooxygenase [Pyrobaculum aerophilum]